MSKTASPYFHQRGTQPTERAPSPLSILDVIDRPRRREPSMAERSGCALSSLAGHDPLRMQTSKHWATGREYDWLGARP